VVFYTLSGAAVFRHLETLKEDASLVSASAMRNQTLDDLWVLTKDLNTFNESLWKTRANMTLVEHQVNLVTLVRHDGYDGRTNNEKWTFSASLMFALRENLHADCDTLTADGKLSATLM